MQDVLEGKTILIIDDDPAITDLVKRILRSANVQVAANGVEGLNQFYVLRPDLVVLDIMLPDMDGKQVCSRLREVANTPVLMLTGLAKDSDVIDGLDCGADDYVTKPFTPGILLARARSILRRTAGPYVIGKTIIYQDDYMRIDLAQRQVWVNQQPVILTTTEYRLLAYLLDHIGQTVTYHQILEQIWGQEYVDSPEYVHVYVSHLRKKLEKNPTRPHYLLTEHGIGYRFQPHHTATLS